MNWTYARPWLLTLEVATIATVLNALVAIPLSYVLARKRFVGRWVMESLVVLPLVLPPTVTGFLLMYVIGNSGMYGVVREWMGYPPPNTLLFTNFAAICASSVVSFPLLVLPIRAAFANVGREFDEEGRIAGLTRLQRFLHIALPMARGGILSGILLGFARALGEFGATLMLVQTSPKTRTLPIQIYLDVGSTNDFAAAWPAVIALGVTSALVILVANRLKWLDWDR